MSVPNNNTFGLDAVRSELGLSYPSSLGACFAAAVDANFDPDYKGAKDRLSNFRNYGISGKVEIVDIVSYPWFSGDQPGLGTSKQNLFIILYKTGVDFPTSDLLNNLRIVKKQSDNSDLFNFGNVNTAWFNTQKLKSVIVKDDYSCETLISPQGLYFYFDMGTNGIAFTVNSSIVITSGRYIRKDFNLVAGTTTPTLLTVSPTSVEFLSNGAPITDATLSFHTTPTGGYYYVLIDDAWISIARDYSNSMVDNTVSVSTNSGAERTSSFLARSVCGKVDKVVTVLQRAEGYSSTWSSYISPSLDYISSGTMYVICTNMTTTMNSQQKTFYWQTRDEYNNVLNSGSFASGLLNAGQTSNHNFYVGSTWVTCYMSPNNSDWYYFASN